MIDKLLKITTIYIRKNMKIIRVFPDGFSGKRRMDWGDG
jgi:hypothetical protein